MIERNNPYIDVEELEKKVKEVCVEKNDNEAKPTTFGEYNIEKKSILIEELRSSLEEQSRWRDISINKFTYHHHGKIGGKIRRFVWSIVAKLAGPLVVAQEKYNFNAHNTISILFKIIELQEKEIKELRATIKNNS